MTDLVDRQDTQGLVIRAYTRLREARYLIGEIRDPSQAGQWLAWLCERVTTGAPHDEDRAVNVALTASGLRKLGLPSQHLAMFSDEFLGGMTEEHRSRALGDTGISAPDGWDWGGPGGAAVDVLLLVYATDDAVLRATVDEHAHAMEGGGVHLAHVLDTSTLEAREHFGFRDGVSQPDIAGLGPQTRPGSIQPGEVLLGYPNEYHRFTPRPLLSPADDPDGLLAPDREHRGLKDLGHGGTYLVFRQLRQDVHAFWEFCETATVLPDGSPDAEARTRLAAKLVGRWPSGAPLVLAPDRDRPQLGTANDFAYAGDDPDGLRCPIGAHIRRSNPRDSLAPAPGTERSLTVNRLHRLVRRGRKFGPLVPREDLLSPGVDPAWRDEERGLHFICLGANLSRQFEFIQQTWLNNPRFAGLYDCPDPLVGSPARSFVVQGQPMRTRYRGLAAFVSVRGGAYFFMPGVGALRYLSTLTRAS